MNLLDRVAPRLRQNTDPWVFGDQFLYSNCKQLGPRREVRTARQYTPSRQPTFLQRLKRGSIIIFGSVVEQGFVVDTVFVVKDSRQYTSQNPPIEVSAAFQFCTIESLAAENAGESALCGSGSANEFYTLYSGVTYEERQKYNNAYSFVPCRRADAKNCRFERPSIELPDYINPSSQRTPSRKLVDADGAYSVWEAVRNRVIDEKCLLGIWFETPPERSS